SPQAGPVSSAWCRDSHPTSRKGTNGRDEPGHGDYIIYLGGASPHVGRARQHTLDLDGDPVAADDDGALGDRKVVRQDPHLVVLARIELDDGAAAEAEHL